MVFLMTPRVPSLDLTPLSGATGLCHAGTMLHARHHPCILYGSWIKRAYLPSGADHWSLLRLRSHVKTNPAGARGGRHGHILLISS